MYACSVERIWSLQLLKHLSVLNCFLLKNMFFDSVCMGDLLDFGRNCYFLESFFFFCHAFYIIPAAAAYTHSFHIYLMCVSTRRHSVVQLSWVCSTFFSLIDTSFATFAPAATLFPWVPVFCFCLFIYDLLKA